MNHLPAKVSGATLAGTILITALAAIPASATSAVAQPQVPSGARSSTSSPMPIEHTYWVQNHGSMTIKESNRPAYRFQITGGEFAPVGLHRGWTGSIQNSNTDAIRMTSGMVSPSTYGAGLAGAFTFTSPKDAIMHGGGTLAGYQDVCGGYVYSGTLAFNNHGETVLVKINKMILSQQNGCHPPVVANS